MGGFLSTFCSAQTGLLLYYFFSSVSPVKSISIFFFKVENKKEERSELWCLNRILQRPICVVVIAVVKKMKTNEKTPKQPVDVSETEGVLSELCYPVTGYYCVTVMVMEVGQGWRLGTREVGGMDAGWQGAPSPPTLHLSFLLFRKT